MLEEYVLLTPVSLEVGVVNDETKARRGTVRAWPEKCREFEQAGKLTLLV